MNPNHPFYQRYHFWYLDIFILQTSIIISFFLWETPTDDLSLRSSPAGSATVWLRPLTRSRSLASIVAMSLWWSCLGRIPKKERMGMVFPPSIFKGKLLVLGRFFHERVIRCRGMVSCMTMKRQPHRSIVLVPSTPGAW